MEDLKQSKRQVVLLKRKLKDIQMTTGSGGDNNAASSAAAASSIDDMEVHTAELLRLKAREEKMNVWSNTLKEQQLRADEDATDMAQEYVQLDLYKKNLKDREIVLKRKEERLNKLYENSMLSVGGDTHNVTQNVTQNVTPSVTQSVTQSVAQGSQGEVSRVEHISYENVRPSTPERIVPNIKGMSSSTSSASLIRSTPGRLQQMKQDEIDLNELHQLRIEGRKQIERFQQITTNMETKSDL